MWIPQLPDSEQPKYLALVDAIARAIECGELAVGERLPPQRRLAWKLGLNPSTTMQAYREAARRHLVAGEVGRGTYVLAGSQEATLFRLKQPNPEHAVIDLSTHIPATDPTTDDFSASLQTLFASTDTASLQGYLRAQDLYRARLQGAAWLAKRGQAVPVENIMLCAGAQQGLFSALLSLCQPGDPVLVESFTAPGIKAACRQLRLPLHGVAMDQHGIVPDDLDRLLRATEAKVVVLTPTLQNPTATIMPLHRQREISAVIERYDVLVIEDDVYGALTTAPPLAHLLGHQGILITSLSKTVAPGLRIGWIVADPSLLARIDPEAHATHWSVAPVCLSMACEWIQNGTAQRRLDWQICEMEQRWRLAKKMLGGAIQSADQPAPHIWVVAPEAVPNFAQSCRAVGVEVVPAEVFMVKPSAFGGIRISLSAALTRAELKIALLRIQRLLAET